VGQALLQLTGDEHVGSGRGEGVHARRPEDHRLQRRPRRAPLVEAPGHAPRLSARPALRVIFVLDHAHRGDLVQQPLTYGTGSHHLDGGQPSDTLERY